MSTGDELRIYVIELARALEQNLPPPPIPPDLPVAAQSEIDLLLAGLGMAATAGDPADMAAAEAGYAERALQTSEAIVKFPANEEQSAQAMQQVMGMAQQVPQQLSSLGQGFGGMFGGFLQQLDQALQQGVQAGQQLAGGLGSGLSSAGEALEEPVEAVGDGLADGLADGFGAGGALLGGPAAAVAGGLGATTPAGTLGPPATPSPSTFPASSSSPPTPPSAPESGSGRGAMGGYPVMPPGAPGAGTANPDPKTDTKRIVAPPVRNGTPVQGRISAPPRLPEVTKRVDGRPVSTRRILALGHPTDESVEPDR